MRAVTTYATAFGFVFTIAAMPFISVDIGRYKEGKSTFVDWQLIQHSGTEAISWVNTGDNLLTVLGSLVGMFVSCGLWQWRKAKAFKRGFDQGIKSNSEVFGWKEDEFSKIESGIRGIAQNRDQYKQKYDSLLDEHSKRLQELNAARDRIEEMKADWQKERDIVNKEVKKEKDSRFKEGREFGEKQTASRLVSLLLQTGQLFYSLDAMTGIVSMWVKGDAKIKQGLPEGEVQWLIALSGMRHPSKENIVPFVAQGPITNYLPREQITEQSEECKVDCEIKHMDKEVYDKVTTQHTPCVWCLDSTMERYTSGEKRWCKKCGPLTKEQERFFSIIGVLPYEAAKIKEALDMPLRDFVKKFPTARPSSGGEWVENDDGECIYYGQSARSYIKINGMFRKA